MSKPLPWQPAEVLDFFGFDVSAAADKVAKSGEPRTMTFDFRGRLDANKQNEIRAGWSEVANTFKSAHPNLKLSGLAVTATNCTVKIFRRS